MKFEIQLMQEKPKKPKGEEKVTTLGLYPTSAGGVILKAENRNTIQTLMRFKNGKFFRFRLDPFEADDLGLCYDKESQYGITEEK